MNLWWTVLFELNLKFSLQNNIHILEIYFVAVYANNDVHI